MLMTEQCIKFNACTQGNVHLLPQISPRTLHPISLMAPSCSPFIKPRTSKSLIPSPLYSVGPETQTVLSLCFLFTLSHSEFSYLLIIYHNELLAPHMGPLQCPSQHLVVVTVVQSLSRVGLFMTMDCSPPGSSVHGILQPRILEWVAISFSRGSSRPRDQTCVFCIGRWILYH